MWLNNYGFSPFDEKISNNPFDSFTSSLSDFEAFSPGSINGQGGWSSTGAAPAGPGFDHAVVNNIAAPASFGARSLRMSNAVTSGSFGNQTFSASLPNEAGETSAVNAGVSGGTRQRKFNAEWVFISADPGNVQNGLSVTASPDRGDGARMSWVQMTDTPTGVDINFSDYQRNLGNSCASGLNFVQTTVANDLDRTVPHAVRIEMEFVDGIANDIVRIYVDGALRHTGTSWEDYFRDCESVPTRTVDSILFRTGGAAVPATLGKGFLIDGASMGTATPTTTVSNPFNAQNWFFFNEGANGTGSYVAGPAAPPIGFGSARLTVDGTGRHNIATLAYAGTRLDQITQLGYSSYQTTNPNAAVAITLQFGMDYNLNDADTTFQGRLVYEPYQSATVLQNVWQTWSPLSGKFWATRAPFNVTCPQANPCTWAQVLAAYPNAGIHTDSVGLGIVLFRAGGPIAGGFDGNVDNFTIGVGSSATTFDFEPINSVVVDDDGMGSAADCNDSTPASSTIQAAVAAANGGDTVRVCPGNYPISSTVALNKPNLTILGAGPARPVIQIPTSTGYGFTVTAPNVTLDNLEIAKADLGSVHNLIFVNANNFTAQNNLIYGPNPGGTWSSTGIVSRAFEVAGGLTSLLIQNNTIHTLRQPAYINTSSGQILNNNVSGTKGWVVDGANLTFTGNTWGEPQNQDCDIALLASVNPANYTPLLSLSTNNDNAFICAQYAGGENGRSVAYVDDSAAPGGNGSDNANHQSITTAVAGTLAGGTVEVAAGGYNEDVIVGKSVTVNGAGVAGTTVTGPIGGGGSTFTVTANNVVIRNFHITRAGNNVADWNNPGLNTVGVAVQGLSITGLSLHNTLITGLRTGIDINNSGSHTIRNNVITDNRTGLIFRNQTDNMTVVENEITNNWTVGVLFLDASGGTNVPVQTALNAAFSNNNISGNWYGQIVERQAGGSLPAPGTTNLKNFGSNWYGTTSPVITTANSAEPGYAGQIPVAFGGTAVPPGGQPDIAGPASGNFDFSPYLNSGADTNVQTTPGRGTYGFQGSFNSLTVTAASPQTNGSLSNIQEGINLVTAGGTLNILNGSYPGNVDINKVLTLKGTPTIVGTLTASVAGAKVSPGFSPGIINSGSLTLTAGTFVDIELNGTTAGTGYDQINVTGSVSLGGATLNVTTGFTPSAGNTFTIINNDNSDPVLGAFNLMPEGTVFFIGGNSFNISYVGGDGNDVVLTAVSLCNTVSIPTGITTPTGAPVTVPVNVDDLTGNGLLSFDTVITYNPAVINAPSVSLTGMTSGRALTVNDSTPGQLVISVYGSLPLTGSGTLMNITFNAVGSIGSTSGVNFSSFVFNEGTPCLSTSNGSVNVISGTLTGSVTYANSVSTTPVPYTTLSGAGSVNVSTQTDLSGNYSLSNFGGGAYTVTPGKTGDVNGINSFDSGLIAQHVVGLSTLNATQLLAADVSGNGSATSFDAALIARYIVLLPNSGFTGEWRFTPTNRSYPSGITANIAGENYTAILLGEVSGNWVAPTSFAPFVEQIRDEDRVRVILPQISAVEDSLVTIPLDVENTTGKGIISYQFDLVYNPDSIEPQEIFTDTADTLSSGMTVTYNSIKGDRLRVVVFGARPLESKGTLLNLKFKVIGNKNASIPLKIENFVFNENAQLALPVDGEVKVSADEDAVSVEGQLLTSSGEEITGVEVVLTDTRGESRTVVSDKSGYFRFGKVTPSETYTISVNSKRYAFTPHVISAADGVTKLNLIAEP